MSEGNGLPKPDWQTADGRVVLFNRDCMEVLPHLGTVDAVVTDPPYGMAFRSNYRIDRHEAIANDGNAWLLEWACKITAKHSGYVFCRWDNIATAPKPRSVITWVKNNWSMGDLDHEHARQTESILFYPGTSHSWPKKRPTDVVYAPRTDNEFHPTEKPVELMLQVVEWTNGTVVDPFMGSGTTGLACAILGRRFIGCEIEPKYFDIACRRIEAELSRAPLFEPAPIVQRSFIGD